MRYCKGCDTHYEVTEFYREQDRVCKGCMKTRQQEYLDRKLAKFKGAVLLFSARARAKRLGVPFTLTEETLPTPTRCPIFGMVMTYGERGGGKGPKDNCATVDRINPKKGYVPGNVFVVSWKANRTRSQLTLAELFKLADGYKKMVQS